MLYLRISLGGKFLGLFRKEDSSMVQTLVNKFGDRLQIATVIAL